MALLVLALAGPLPFGPFPFVALALALHPSIGIGNLEPASGSFYGSNHILLIVASYLIISISLAICICSHTK